MKAHKHLPTDSNMDIVFTIVAPYFMYIAAEEVHSSGVLAVVSGGLLLSSNVHLFLRSRSRLRGLNFWESLVFVLNGLVFMLIGLDLPEIVAGLRLEGVSIVSAIGYGVLVTLVLVVGRILSAYGAVFVTLIARNFITVADTRHPGYRVPFVLGWTGMRGVVSLAAALSIPVQLADGSAFPQRNLILFITFVVILLTLLVQGLTLPYLIKKMNIYDSNAYVQSEEAAESMIRKGLADHALFHIRTNHSEELASQPLLQKMARKWEDHSLLMDDVLMAQACKLVYLDILEQQRQWLLTKNREDATLDEDLIRKHLTHIDLEEEKLTYM